MIDLLPVGDAVCRRPEKPVLRMFGEDVFGTLKTIVMTFTPKNFGKMNRVVAHARVNSDLVKVFEAFEGLLLDRGVVVEPKSDRRVGSDTLGLLDAAAIARDILGVIEAKRRVEIEINSIRTARGYREAARSALAARPRSKHTDPHPGKE